MIAEFNEKHHPFMLRFRDKQHGAGVNLEIVRAPQQTGEK